ncbi:hypothetical protein CTAYLR_009659 [Chrysophaeum taylorii]|uniref:Uncharacterized protein n=1 Tax=Chrysophaeum taylorii TaxID=2483200 RepID=A0AAD7UJ42_9STRA|nr:hypothetical protein CTAYLR_009659 [Chrysophaeum taylorii]
MARYGVFFLLLRADALPTLLTCDRDMAVGSTIMGEEAISSDELSVVFERDGTEVACGSTYVPGEQLTARLVNSTGPAQYVLQVSGGTFQDQASGCEGEYTCNGTRCSKSDSSGQTVLAPSNETVSIELLAGWAETFGAVFIADTCTLIHPNQEGDGGDDDDDGDGLSKMSFFWIGFASGFGVAGLLALFFYCCLVRPNIRPKVNKERSTMGMGKIPQDDA